MRNRSDCYEGRIPDPFNGAAPEQLINMGIIQDDGTPDENNIAAFIAIFSGMFFMDLKQFYNNTDHIAIIYNAFSALHSKKYYRHMYLLYSIQYDYFRKPLPDPVWWIAGKPELIETFMDGFLPQLGKLIEKSALLSGCCGRPPP